MDDRELEARLRAALHRRFDRATPPASLERSVAAIFAGPAPRARGQWFLPRVAWAAGAMAIAVVLLVALTLRPAPIVGPASTPTPSVGGVTSASPAGQSSPTTAGDSRLVIVLATLPERAAAEESQAEAAFSTRLSVIGAPPSGTAVGDGAFVTFVVPAGGPSDAEIRDVLSARGAVSLVGYPASIPEVAQPEPVVGQPLPRGLHEELVGPGGSFGPLAFMSWVVPGDGSGVTMQLQADAARLVGGWLADHTGGRLVLVLDDRVVMAPFTSTPGADGRLVIPAAPGDGTMLQQFAAVVHTPLPPAWSAPSVPVTISKDRADALALELSGSTTTPVLAGDDHSLGLQGIRVPGAVPTEIAVWEVMVNGTFGPSPGCGANPTPTFPAVCREHTNRILFINAVTGELVSTVF